MKSKSEKSKVYEVLDDLKLSRWKNFHEKFQKLDLNMLPQIHQEIDEYYQKSKDRILNSLKNDKDSIKIFPNEGKVDVPSYIFDGKNVGKLQSPFDESFINAICLYADKLVIFDPFYLAIERIKNFGLIPQTYQDLYQSLSTLVSLKALADENLLTLIPYNAFPLELTKSIEEVSKKESQNNDFKKVCLKNMRVSKAEGTVGGKYPYLFLNAEIGKGSPYKILGQWMPTIPPKTLYGIGFTPHGPIMETPTERIPLEMKEILHTDSSKNKHVEDFVLSTIYQLSHQLNTNLYFSEYINSKLVAGLEIDNEILHWKFNQIYSKPPAKSKIIPHLLSLNLPFIDEIDTNEIIKIRNREEGAFLNFRSEFNKICFEIEQMNPDEDIENIAREIVNERIKPQIKLLDDQIKSIDRRSLSYQIITSVVTVSSSIFAGGLSLVPGIAAIIAEGVEWNYKISSLRNNPMYYLWKIKHRSRGY